MLNPAYDNAAFQPKMHPVQTDYTIDSWRCDILDFGSSSDQSTSGGQNISMVKERYADYHISHNGKWDVKSGLPINDGGLGFDGNVTGYEIEVEKSAGLMIADISRCGAIKLAL
jgi:hypothetical protein